MVARGVDDHVKRFFSAINKANFLTTELFDIRPNRQIAMTQVSNKAAM